jgi:hypothetical protein
MVAAEGAVEVGDGRVAAAWALHKYTQTRQVISVRMSAIQSQPCAARLMTPAAAGETQPAFALLASTLQHTQTHQLTLHTIVQPKPCAKKSRGQARVLSATAPVQRCRQQSEGTLPACSFTDTQPTRLAFTVVPARAPGRADLVAAAWDAG